MKLVILQKKTAVFPCDFTTFDETGIELLAQITDTQPMKA